MEEKAVINHAKASKCYQWSIWAIVGLIISAVVFQPVDQTAFTVGAYIIYAIIAYHWAGALAKRKWLWAVITLTPIINIVAVLMLANETTKACKADGIKMGFFGGIKT